MQCRTYICKNRTLFGFALRVTVMGRSFSVLFVCYENICRSPMAEGLFRDAVSRRGADGTFAAESAGTVCLQDGEPADRRAVMAADAFGIDISDHRARCTRDIELGRYSRIFVMDRENYRDILPELTSYGDGRVSLIAEYLQDPDIVDVEDPYYGSQDDFQKVCGMLREAVENICDELIPPGVPEKNPE